MIMQNVITGQIDRVLELDKNSILYTTMSNSIESDHIIRYVNELEYKKREVRNNKNEKDADYICKMLDNIAIKDLYLISLKYEQVKKIAYWNKDKICKISYFIINIISLLK